MDRHVIQLMLLGALNILCFLANLFFMVAEGSLLSALLACFNGSLALFMYMDYRFWENYCDIYSSMYEDVPADEVAEFEKATGDVVISARRLKGTNENIFEIK